MRSYILTRCRDCGHEEVRYANVKHCRVCRGPIERPAPVDERDAEIARLRARVTELEWRIGLFGVDWILRDDVGAQMILEARPA